MMLQRPTWKSRSIPRDRRRAAITIESILAICILVIVTVAVVEYGVIVMVQNAVSHAAIKGAREAGKGADINEVVAEVNMVLAPHNITVGTDATVILEDPATALIVSSGSIPCTAPAAPPTITSGNVRVTVCTSMGIVPFLTHLQFFGIDFSSKTLQMSAVSRKEL